MTDKLAEWAKRIVYSFAVLFLFFLSITAMIYRSDGYELSVNTWQVIPRIIIGLGTMILLYFVASWVERLPVSVQYALLVVLFAGVMYFCYWWIINSANLPKSDAESIYNIACRARDHDLLPIAPKDSYMSLWPFQAGLVMFEETILRLIPAADEMTIQLIYLPFMALSLISAYMLVRRLFLKKRTRIYWCVLMTLCLPYYLYVNNMYGEVPSMALLFFCLWMVTEFLSAPSWWKGVLAGVGMAGAVAIRKNSLIILLACILILIFHKSEARTFVRGGQRIIVLILLIAATAGNILPRVFYEYRAHNEMGKGVPAVSYIAMGLQWSEGRSPGGWNGYHSDLYINNDYNRKSVIEASKNSIRESLEYMLEHPKYTMRFFYYKLTGQWCREDFVCLYSTLSGYGERSQKAWDIYEGATKDKIMYILSIHQNIIYFGALLFCIDNGFAKRKERPGGAMWQLVLLVSFIGGFLFSILWEAGARYVLPYYVMLIPYAADGWAISVGTGVNTLVTAFKRRNKAI